MLRSERRKKLKEYQNKYKLPTYLWVNGFGSSPENPLWHNVPRKYHLVLRGPLEEVIYVPIGDKTSSELNGGFWALNPKKNRNLTTYGDCVIYANVNKKKVEQFTNVAKEITKKYTPKQLAYDIIWLDTIDVAFTKRTFKRIAKKNKIIL